MPLVLHAIIDLFVTNRRALTEGSHIIYINSEDADKHHTEHTTHFTVSFKDALHTRKGEAKFPRVPVWTTLTGNFRRWRSASGAGLELLSEPDSPSRAVNAATLACVMDTSGVGWKHGMESSPSATAFLIHLRHTCASYRALKGASFGLPLRHLESDCCWFLVQRSLDLPSNLELRQNRSPLASQHRLSFL